MRSVRECDVRGAERRHGLDPGCLEDGSAEDADRGPRHETRLAKRVDLVPATNDQAGHVITVPVWETATEPAGVRREHERRSSPRPTSMASAGIGSRRILGTASVGTTELSQRRVHVSREHHLGTGAIHRSRKTGRVKAQGREMTAHRLHGFWPSAGPSLRSAHSKSARSNTRGRRPRFGDGPIEGAALRTSLPPRGQVLT